MKIYHLASFKGNIGDMGNHTSFYRLFRENIHSIDVLHQEEIREYYYANRLKRFDAEFVAEVNKHDLFVLGGGNFFELCWDYSETGTTFDISTKFLKEIKVPILINAIGIDDSKGITNSTIKKFENFLEVLFNYTNCFFTVRNDGSKEVVEKYFPKFKHFIIEIPDWGFSYEHSKEFQSSTKYIGVNIVKDASEIRYKDVDYEMFLKKMAIELNGILESTKYNLMFLPHILSDLQASLDLLDYIKPEFRRSRISFAPLNLENPLELFTYYQKCFFIYGMRFHSNICSYALGVPIYGIHNIKLHVKMQESCGRKQMYYCDISKNLNGLSNLANLLNTQHKINNLSNIKVIRENERKKALISIVKIKKWLEKDKNENKTTIYRK